MAAGILQAYDRHDSENLSRTGALLSGERPEMGSDIVKNILSFGAEGRVQDALEKFRKVESDFHNTHGAVERQQLATNASLDRLIETKLVAIERLKLVNKIPKF